MPDQADQADQADATRAAAGAKVSGLKIFKAAGTILLILFIPLIRSCGNISSGFPFVALSQASGPGIQIHWLNLALNIAVVGSVAALLVLGMLRTADGKAKALLASGFDFVGIYALLVTIGYIAVYPLFANAKENSAGSAFFIAYAFFIHPWIGWSADFNSLFPAAAKDSPLFGDSYDLPMRAGFLGMCALWFGLGCLKALLLGKTARKKPLAAPPSG